MLIRVRHLLFVNTVIALYHSKIPLWESKGDTKINNRKKTF